MYLLRVQLPETPGSLGAVASAMGTVGANIQAIEIVGHGPGFAIDDFIVSLPREAMADSLVSACQTIDAVRVLWVSRSHTEWTIASDIDVLNAMTADPGQARTILVREVPNLFHSAWAMLVDTSGMVLDSTPSAPEFTQQAWEQIGCLSEERTLELDSGWIPDWGETTIAVVPVNDPLVILMGRLGGPEYLPSELARLRHLAILALPQ